jgi:hypothetical protein
LRRKVNGASGFSSGPIIVQTGVLAYLFASSNTTSFFILILLLYFSVQAFLSLRGVESAVRSNAFGVNARPPLRRPKRIRTANEYTLASLSFSFCFFLAGMLMLGETSKIAEKESNLAVEDKNPVVEKIEESVSAQIEASQKSSEADKSTAASPPNGAGLVYNALEGETLKHIYQKIYGDQKHIYGLVRLNPQINSRHKLHAGDAIHLPSPETLPK